MPGPLPAPDRGTAVFGRALLASLLLLTATLVLTYLWNEDFWWYVSSGRAILAEGGIPDRDPFLYTVPPGAWVVHSWLWTVLVAALERVGGVEAALAASAAVAIGTLVLLWNAARVDRFGVTNTLVGLGWLVAVGAGYLAKAAAASALLLAGYLQLLESSRLRTWRLWGALVALQTLWANLHGGYPLGVAAVAAYSSGEWLERRRAGGADRPDPRLPLWLPLLLLAVSMIGPGGIAARLAPFGFVAGAESVQPAGDLGTMLIVEWRSPFRAGGLALGALVFAALVGIASFVAAPRQRLGRWILFLAFAALAATAVRHVGLFALVAGFCALRNLGERAAVRSARAGKAWPRRQVFAAAGLGVLLVSSSVLLRAGRQAFEAGQSASRFFTQGPRLGSPRAVAVLGDLPGPLFNDFQLGAYLGAHGSPQHRFFIDGRVLDPRLVVEYTRMVDSSDAWQRAAARWGFRTAVLGLYSKTLRAPLGTAVRADRAWRLASLDPLAAVYHRGDVAAAAPTAVSGPVPFDAGALGWWAPGAAALQRLFLREDPDNYLIEYLAVLGQLGFSRDASAVASQALRSRPRHPLLLRQRCAARAALGEFAGAIEDCALASRLAPEDGGIAALHCLVLARAGRTAEARDRLAQALRRLPNDPELRRVERQLGRT